MESDRLGRKDVGESGSWDQDLRMPAQAVPGETTMSNNQVHKMLKRQKMTEKMLIRDGRVFVVNVMTTGNFCLFFFLNLSKKTS